MSIVKDTRYWPAIAGLLLLCVVVYWNSLHGEFQFDDDHLIRFNFALRNFSDWQGIAGSEKFRPLTMLTFALNYRIAGQNTFVYHLTNLFLHMITVALFFRFSQRLVSGFAFAFFSAALFAVHPINTESVAYISSRSILLCGVFVIASILAFDAYVRSSKTRFAVLFMLFVLLGMLSREEAALIPFLALIYNYVFFRDKVERVHAISISLVLVGLGYRLLSHLQGGNEYVQDFLTYGPTEIYVWLRYLWLAIFPVQLNADHDISPLSPTHLRFWLSLLAVAAILFAVFKSRRKHPVLFFFGLWFFVNLLPSFFIPLGDAMAEHRIYIAVMGFCACVGYMIPVFRTARTRPSLIAGALCVLLLFYSVAAWKRSAVWANSIDLWYDTVRKSPGKARPRVNLAFALFERHAYDDAILQYKAALGLDPQMMRAHNGLGYCFLYKNDPEAAEKEFTKALSIDPNFVDAKTGMGVVRFQQGRYADALSYSQQTLMYRQESVELIAMMAVSLIETGQTAEAARLLTERRNLYPRFAEIVEQLSREASVPAELRRLTALSTSLR